MPSHLSSRGARLLSLLRDPQKWSVSVLRLTPNGVLGLHPAASDQLMFVFQGSGTVRAQGTSPQEVRSGALVLWSAGEVHETDAGPDGLSALIVEGSDLNSAIPKSLPSRSPEERAA